MKNILSEADGTQVTDLAKKVDYGRLVKPFKRGKLVKSKVVDSEDAKRDLAIEPGSDEEVTIDSLYDKNIGGYICTGCGETIKNITDFRKRRYKDGNISYFCPFCMAGYSPEELDQILFYETDIDGTKLKQTYQGKGVKMASTFDEPEVYENKISDNSVSNGLLVLEKIIYESPITEKLLSNIKDNQEVSAALGRLEGSLEAKGIISNEDGQAISDRGFAQAVSSAGFDYKFDKEALSKAVDAIRSVIGDHEDLKIKLDKIESILTKYVK